MKFINPDDNDSIKSIHPVSSCDSLVPNQQVSLPVAAPQSNSLPVAVPQSNITFLQDDDPLFPTIRKRTSVSGEDEFIPSTSNCPASPNKKSKHDRKRQREETPKSARPADAVSGSSKFLFFSFSLQVITLTILITFEFQHLHLKISNDKFQFNYLCPKHHLKSLNLTVMIMQVYTHCFS